MMLNIISQIAKLLFKTKSRTGSSSRSGSDSGSAYFLPEVPEAEAPEAEAPEAEAPGVEAEALKISALPHHCSKASD
jgi:hypothetical protein